ncbi:MAG: LysR family transcriptional regulator [Acidobacteria bacterium]|nr:LysR family transcriptional regulator [Acidobacteriota bacterium]
MIELRHLRYFLAVSEELHFGRAAKRVHISQPPLSQQIRQLEENLGVQLFYRTRRKVELTDAGRVFAGEARLILEQVEHATGLVEQANRGKLSRLVVACSPANSHMLVEIIQAFADRHPEVRMVVKSFVTPQQVEALRNNRIDIGFITLPVEGKDLTVEPILRERHVVAMPKSHPLASRKRVTLRALASETWIIFPLYMSPGRYQLIADLCRRAGISLHVVHEVDNVHTMLELIASGFGVSLMRASLQAIRTPGVVFRELLHSPFVETAVIYRREHDSELLRDFVEISRAAFASLGHHPGLNSKAVRNRKVLTKASPGAPAIEERG